MKRITKDEYNYLMEKTGRGKRSDFLYKDFMFMLWMRMDRHVVSSAKFNILERRQQRTNSRFH